MTIRINSHEGGNNFKNCDVFQFIIASRLISIDMFSHWHVDDRTNGICLEFNV